MKIEKIANADQITDLAKKRFQEERGINHLEGWFLAKEIQRSCDSLFANEPDCIRIAKTQVKVAEQLPLWISDYCLFAGTQDDAFARSYALINPAFKVDSFKGYCDPVAVFGDIDPIGDITQERIDDLHNLIHLLFLIRAFRLFIWREDNTALIFFVNSFFSSTILL